MLFQALKKNIKAWDDYIIYTWNPFDSFDLFFYWVKPTLNKKGPFQAQQGPFGFLRSIPMNAHELAAWLDIVQVKDIYQDSFLGLRESLEYLGGRLG